MIVKNKKDRVVKKVGQLNNKAYGFKELSKDDCRLAKKLLENFVKKIRTEFQQLSFNFHNLLHIRDVVRFNGLLDKYSAYKFKKFYFLLKH